MRELWSMHGVQGQIQFQDVDAWLAEHSERARLGVSGDKGRDLIDGKTSGRSDAIDLKLRRGRADVRIESASRGGDQIARNRAGLGGMCGAKGADAFRDGVEQRRVGRAQVTAGRCGAVVRWTRGRWSAPKVTRVIERLADQR